MLTFYNDKNKKDGSFLLKKDHRRNSSMTGIFYFLTRVSLCGAIVSLYYINIIKTSDCGLKKEKMIRGFLLSRMGIVLVITEYRGIG